MDDPAEEHHLVPAVSRNLPSVDAHTALEINSHPLPVHCVGDCPGDPPMATITWDKLTVVARDSKGNSKELLKVGPCTVMTMLRQEPLPMSRLHLTPILPPSFLLSLCSK